jgi:hypothetical protein
MVVGNVVSMRFTYYFNAIIQKVSLNLPFIRFLSKTYIVEIPKPHPFQGQYHLLTHNVHIRV